MVEFNFPTKMVKLADLDQEMLRTAWHRSEVRDDPCAEYHIGEGWGIIAHDVAVAQREGKDEIVAFYDKELLEVFS
jgi:hypothetical protein